MINTFLTYCYSNNPYTIISGLQPTLYLPWHRQSQSFLLKPCVGSEFFKHYVPDNQLLFKMKTMHYLPGKGVVRHLGKKNFKDNRGDHYIQSKKSKKKQQLHYVSQSIAKSLTEPLQQSCEASTISTLSLKKAEGYSQLLCFSKSLSSIAASKSALHNHSPASDNKWYPINVIHPSYASILPPQTKYYIPLPQYNWCSKHMFINGQNNCINSQSPK